MGEVWLAQHRNLQTNVALKFLLLETDADPAFVTRARALFRQEAQLSAHLGALTSHVVRVHDVGVAASTYFLVMEYIAGPSLAELFCDGPVALDVLVAILEQVAAALDVAHENGVVHRDVKPGNILLARRADGALEVKLADFGVAKVLSTRGAHRDLVGTLEYMSPEQLVDGELDARSDVWSLGVVAYRALTGVLPFRAARHPLDGRDPFLDIEPRPPSGIAQNVPHAVDEWLKVALAKSRDGRFRSAGECARALRACLRSPRAARTAGSRELSQTRPIQGPADDPMARTSRDPRSRLFLSFDGARSPMAITRPLRRQRSQSV